MGQSEVCVFGGWGRICLIFAVLCEFAVFCLFVCLNATIVSSLSALGVPFQY